jgi:hypothetical protein
VSVNSRRHAATDTAGYGVAGTITSAGTWHVVVGNAKVVSAARRSHIEVFL